MAGKFFFLLVALAFAAAHCSELFDDGEREAYALMRNRRQVQDCFKTNSNTDGQIYQVSCTAYCMYHGYWPKCVYGSQCTCVRTMEESMQQTPRQPQQQFIPQPPAQGPTQMQIPLSQPPKPRSLPTGSNFNPMLGL